MKVVYGDARSCVIEVEDQKLPWLAELDRYSHAILLHRVAVDPAAPLARHGPRPTGLDVTVVELLGRDEELLRVRGLDVPVGTEIADLLPYDPDVDAVPMAVKPSK